MPYIESVIEEDRQAKIEAARPKITIDFAGLDKIRQDALETQGSLLTEEDAQGAPAKSAESAERYTEAASAVRTQASVKAGMESSAAIPSGSANSSGESVPLDNAPVLPSMTSLPLDGTQARLLRMLLRGEPVQALIAAQHGLPHVIADSINEALFDYIGDNAVDCDGETFTLVEDYRGEIAKIVGEETT